jgi:alkanesulfonate monooxygenase SsuD/methylene tetrahydromethanopterin reductase-like flavin-dependent oxidoreductase (luciferase family)/predicted kinase
VLELPDPVVVVLVGAAGSGKSHWAAEHFAANQIVSSDALRAAVGRGENDLDVSVDAFALLDTIVAQRISRRLTTVVDTLGFDAELRRRVIELARTHRVPCHVVIMQTPDALCKERNRQRTKRVSATVLDDQLRRVRTVTEDVVSEPFDRVHVVAAEAPAVVESVAPRADEAPSSRVRFGLQISSFPWPASEHRARLTEIAQAAEAAGFDSIWVMDHFRQIPQLGREWDDMYESISTLSFLAGKTERVTLGPLVASMTHRNIGVFGKAMATLDVLSGGRAVCGLGLGWFAEEHAAYGLEFPSVNDRYALLEDALQALPLLWGKGGPSFDGARYKAKALVGYPRPLQARIPIVLGGSGERRTLKLAAKYADACNLFGDALSVARKVAVLREHCATVGRDPGAVAVTHLGTALVGINPKDLAEQIDRIGAPKKILATMNPGTAHDHVNRSQALVDAGANHLIVSLPGLRVDDVKRYASVIRQFGEISS